MNKPHEMAVSERLDVFLKAVNMNPFSLSKKIGGTSQKYYKIIQGKSNPQYETVERILDAFPELSAEWLMRGRGEMFITERDLATVSELQEKLQEKDSIIIGLKYLAKDSLVKTKGAAVMPAFTNLFRKKNPRFILWNQGISKRKGL